MDCKPNGPLCPWDFPGKNTGMGYHFLLQGIFPRQGSNPSLLLGRRFLYHWTTWESPLNEVTKSCLFRNLKDNSPLGSSVDRILQARILEWVAISFSFKWGNLSVKRLPFQPLQSRAANAAPFPVSMGSGPLNTMVFWQSESRPS